MNTVLSMLSIVWSSAPDHQNHTNGFMHNRQGIGNHAVNSPTPNHHQVRGGVCGCTPPCPIMGVCSCDPCACFTTIYPNARPLTLPTVAPTHTHARTHTHKHKPTRARAHTHSNRTPPLRRPPPHPTKPRGPLAGAPPRPRPSLVPSTRILTQT